MIILIHGTTHTGKTNLSQHLIEKHKFPSFSIDHLKMGLIRSHYTTLTPDSKDSELTKYLWPIVSEMIKTAIENNQNLIIEGVYIPFDYQEDFEDKYLKEINGVCLIMSEEYIEKNFRDIKDYSSVIEKRLDDSYVNKEDLIKDNNYHLKMCTQYQLDYILIKDKYDVIEQWETKYDI